MCPLHPFKANGAEEEDDVEHHETESKPAVQLPMVQMDTQDLGRKSGRTQNLFPVAASLIGTHISHSLKRESTVFRAR